MEGTRETSAVPLGGVEKVVERQTAVVPMMNGAGGPNAVPTTESAPALASQDVSPTPSHPERHRAIVEPAGTARS